MQKRDMDYYLALPYKEVIEPDPSGGYVGYFPELHGCITQAETKEELLEMLEDAKECWISAAYEDGVEIPEPDEERSSYSGKFNLRMPKTLHRSLAMAAKAEGVSQNQLAVCFIAGALGLPAAK